MKANHHAWIYTPPSGRDRTARVLAWAALIVGVVNGVSICYTASIQARIRGHVERIEERRAMAPLPDPPRFRVIRTVEEGLEAMKAMKGIDTRAWEVRP